MKNKKWFYYDPEAWMYKLTEEGKKIPKVVESYEEYYRHFDYKESSNKL